jgi:hypothetical protein
VSAAHPESAGDPCSPIFGPNQHARHYSAKALGEVMEKWSPGEVMTKQQSQLLHHSTTLFNSAALCLITETLLMAILLHALTALVLGNFRFASFF